MGQLSCFSRLSMGLGGRMVDPVLWTSIMQKSLSTLRPENVLIFHKRKLKAGFKEARIWTHPRCMQLLVKCWYLFWWRARSSVLYTSPSQLVTPDPSHQLEHTFLPACCLEIFSKNCPHLPSAACVTCPSGHCLPTCSDRGGQAETTRVHVTVSEKTQLSLMVNKSMSTSCDSSVVLTVCSLAFT